MREINMTEEKPNKSISEIEHNIKVCVNGIKLNDKNLDYHISCLINEVKDLIDKIMGSYNHSPQELKEFDSPRVEIGIKPEDTLRGNHSQDICECGLTERDSIHNPLGKIQGFHKFKPLKKDICECGYNLNYHLWESKEELYDKDYKRDSCRDFKPLKKDVCADCEHYVEFNGEMVCDKDTLESGDCPFLVKKDYSCKKFKPLKKDVPPWKYVDGRPCGFCGKPVMSEEEFWSHKCSGEEKGGKK